jgi:hypothetical protein
MPGFVSRDGDRNRDPGDSAGHGRPQEPGLAPSREAEACEDEGRRVGTRPQHDRQRPPSEDTVAPWPDRRLEEACFRIVGPQAGGTVRRHRISYFEV